MRKRVLSLVIVAAAALGTIALFSSTPAQANPKTCPKGSHLVVCPSGSFCCPNNALCVCFP